MSATRRNTLIAVAVVVMAGLLVVGFLLGRRSPSANPAPANPATGSPSAGAASTPASSPAGTSGASDALPRGRAVSTGGGSKPGPEGVVLGYPHTPEGAVSAVTNYAMIMTLPAIADPKVAAAIAESIAAPGSTNRIVDYLRSVTDFTRDQYVLSTHPNWGAYAVISYNDNEALVAVWSPLIFGKGANYTPPPDGKVNNVLGTLWSVNSYRVVWAQGDWKWVDSKPVDNAGENLNPENPDVPPSAQEKSEILHRPNPETALNDVGYQSWDWMEYADA